MLFGMEEPPIFEGITMKQKEIKTLGEFIENLIIMAEELDAWNDTVYTTKNGSLMLGQSTDQFNYYCDCPSDFKEKLHKSLTYGVRRESNVPELEFNKYKNERK